MEIKHDGIVGEYIEKFEVMASIVTEIRENILKITFLKARHTSKQAKVVFFNLVGLTCIAYSIANRTQE